MTKCNMTIRHSLKEHGLKQWELANLLGVSEATVVRMFRTELPEEKQEHILSVIEQGAKQ